MSGEDRAYCVEVRGNLVASISHVGLHDAAGVIHDDRLAVSTELSETFQKTGRFDGRYYLADAELARHFAALCLGFMQNLCDTSAQAVSNIRLETGEDWVNPHLPEI